MKNQYNYGQRFVGGDNLKQVISPYDQDSKLFEDLKQRGIKPVKVVTIDLSVAGSRVLDEPGFHFVQWGFENSAGKPVNTTSLVQVLINQISDNGEEPFPAKHARGFSGPFASLFLKWDAQLAGGSTPVFCSFVIFKGAQEPWIDGEAGT